MAGVDAAGVEQRGSAPVGMGSFGRRGRNGYPAIEWIPGAEQILDRVGIGEERRIDGTVDAERREDFQGRYQAKAEQGVGGGR